MNRVVDIAVAGIGLVISAPVCAVIAVLIKFTSDGPVLFRQERVGLRGHTFTIHKFRTMRTEHQGPAVSSTSDPRITPIGAILRQSKLDELPQLWDVVRGEMSLVGPRPEVPEYVKQWPDDLRPLILSVRPGITDPASIHYRNEAAELEIADDPASHYIKVILPRKAKMYAEYVEHRSMSGDIKIILQTIRTVVAS
ncbi:sugar transferase [Glutamicibacter arilaitensis]|uniref:sugar transferase n=1 Tax=Glutamicibacter arilaitensis TaxID=256701 RepID=UPI003850873C